MAAAWREFKIFCVIMDTVSNRGIAMAVPARSIHVGMNNPVLAATDKLRVMIAPTKAARITSPVARKSTPGVINTILMVVQEIRMLVGNCRCVDI
jgi:hypothetical protein